MRLGEAKAADGFALLDFEARFGSPKIIAAAIADSAVPASAADPGGLTASTAANNGTLGAYIATNGVNPGSAIGIAVNIVTDAIQYNLVAELQAF